MQRGFFIRRRDAHQPGHRQAQIAAQRNKPVGLRGQHPGFLFLFPGVHLDEQRRAMAQLLCQPRNGLRQFRAVQRMDDIKQLHCLARLVALQRPDQMQLNTFILFTKARPLARRLLHPILTEHPMALFQHKDHIFIRLHL